MKKILLIGDSIRKGYDLYVKESMQGLAEVYYPEENCRFAEYVLRHVHMWRDDLSIDQVDAVHWNVGLWDNLRIYGDECLTPIDTYAAYIERIAKRLKFLFPNAVQIFATSTPVIEDGYVKEYEMRYNKDTEAYNEAAVRVLTPLGVRINDLYALMRETPDSYHSDQTHYYTAEGTARIGGRVNAVLCDALGLDPAALTPPDPNKFIVTTLKNDNELYVKRGHLYEPVLGI
jgi:hypothetical protein